MISTEVLLILAVYGLYAIDGCLLLYQNEALLIACPKKHWQVKLAEVSRHFFGRLLFFPNFFAVGFRFYHCCWHTNETAFNVTPHQSIDRILKIENRLFPLIVLARIQGVLLFICLPISLLFPVSPWLFVITIAIAYLLSLAMIVIFALRIKDFGIGVTDFVMMALICLVCLPNAVNLPKSIAAKAKCLADLLPMAKQLLDNQAYHDLLCQIDKRVEEEMNLLEPEDKEWQPLFLYRQHLNKELS